jgi:hypothetical protein
MELAGETEHKTKSGRAVADLIQIKPRPIVLNIKLETTVALRPSDLYCVVCGVPDAMLRCVG